MSEPAGTTPPRRPRRRRFYRARLALSLPSKALYAAGIRSTRSLCLPDFLIIGAPKAGTTWLAENLEAHPQVYLGRRPGTTDPTEVRYFNQSFRLPLSYYSSLFLSGKGRIKGDKTPGYCTLSRFRIRFIRSIMPDVRIVFFMRHPVDRAWSHAVMNFVKIEGSRIDQVPPSRLYGYLSRSRPLGLYTEILDRWRGVFGEEQVYAGLYDGIASDPLGVLRDVVSHIGADTDVDWSRFPYRRVFNEGRRAPMPAEYRRFLEEMYGDEIARLDARLGGAVSSWRPALAGSRPDQAVSASPPR